MTHCIPFLETEHLRYWGMAHECVTNDKAVIIIIGFFVFITLIAIISSFNQNRK